MPKIKRPQNLDQRVFFCDDFPSNKFVHEHDLLYLWIHYDGKKKFKWLWEFDILESGITRYSVAFTKDEWRRIYHRSD